MAEGTALWFGAAGFEVLDVAEVDGELVVAVETVARLTGCSSCGRRAVPKDRRWVTLRDSLAGSMAVPAPVAEAGLFLPRR